MAAVRLGDLLVRMGVLTQPELDHAIALQVRQGVRLGQILVDHGLVAEDRVVEALAHIARLPRLDLRTVQVDPAAHRWSTSQWTEQHLTLPIAVDRVARTLTVVISDPTDVGPLDELAFRTGLKVQAVVGSDREVLHLHRHVFHGAPLARDRRSIPRLGPQDPRSADTSEAPEVLHGMAALRDDLQHTSQPPAPALAVPAAPLLPAADPEGLLVPRLRHLLDAQLEAARELQVLFELCVSHGIIQRSEYLERLERDDAP